MGDVVASPSALNNTKTTAPRDHTGLALSGNLPGAAGNLLEVAGALGTHPGAAEAPGTHQEAAGDLGLNQRPYRAGALGEPPRCGREHPSSGWGHWDPPKGSRGPMDPSQRQLVTWFSPRDHTGLTLLGNHPRATGNLLEVAGATWDPPRGSRGPRDPPRGSQGPWSYPDKVVPPGTLQVRRMRCTGSALMGDICISQRSKRKQHFRDHTGLAALRNHPCDEQPPGVARPRDCLRAARAQDPHPEAARDLGLIQIRWCPLGPSRCVGDPSKGGWDSLDPPMDGGPHWNLRMDCGGPRKPHRGGRALATLPRSDDCTKDPPRGDGVLQYLSRDHTGLTLLGNHPRATGNLLEVAGATWDPPRGSRGPRDPPRGSQGPWSYPDKVVPPGTLQRPYRAGALGEPPRCGREHPSSGWGHWDPPKGSRGPMDPSQRQLVTWFSPRDHTGLALSGNLQGAAGNIQVVVGAIGTHPEAAEAPWTQSQRQLVTWFSPRDHIGLTLLGNHPRATGNVLGVARATWDPPRGSRGPMDPPRGSQGRWSYPDKVMPPGTLQWQGTSKEGWGPLDPTQGQQRPHGPIPEAAGDLVLTRQGGASATLPRCIGTLPQGQFIGPSRMQRPESSHGIALVKPLRSVAGSLLPPQKCEGTMTPPGNVEAHSTFPGVTAPLGTLPGCVGDPSKGGWDSLDPPMDGGPHWNHRMDCRGPRKPHRGGRALATPPRSDDCTKDPPRGGGGPQYLSRCDSAPRDPPWRPYRAGALREPPRCGREYPNSGWGHWDPPRGSRGPMDPSQRQLVTWFSP
ncbi:collagen alpha-1(III) chain-like, partial [Homarus americanus]|uniref:collagen alpha-1(III) chain-like n=1 Tax=Homarus americanus TaxID=6706 RepID=UPI001C4932BB